MLSFVTGALKPVKSETDSHLSHWFKEHSLIFVAPDHACWTDAESAKKVRRNRFGRVRQSECEGLDGMLVKYLEEACAWVEKEVAESMGTEEMDAMDDTEGD